MPALGKFAECDIQDGKDDANLAIYVADTVQIQVNRGLHRWGAGGGGERVIKKHVQISNDCIHR